VPQRGARQPLADALDAFERTAAPEDTLLLTGSHKLVAVLPDAWRQRAGAQPGRYE